MADKFEIVRTEDIVVSSTSKDKYDNMVVTSKGGKEYKVSAKRSRLFDLFKENQAVHLEYGSYMDKEYIANAKPMQDVLPAQPANQPKEPMKVIQQKASPDMSKDEWNERDRKTRRSIERQKSLELAVEFAKIKGSDDTKKVLNTATAFYEWISQSESLVEEAKKLGAVPED
jgi:hypothetical protein